jgi:hypothetical protein
MKTVQLQKYKQALEHADEYIAEMSLWDEKRLEKHLSLFQKQMQMAYDQQNHNAYILLQEYERQVILARLEKC